MAKFSQAAQAETKPVSFRLDKAVAVHIAVHFLNFGSVVSPSQYCTVLHSYIELGFRVAILVLHSTAFQYWIRI